MSDPDRDEALQLFQRAMQQGEPLSWFEEFYRRANGDARKVPWADLGPNTHLLDWHRQSQFQLAGKRCLSIGCGLGDDCEYLQKAGGVVTGFDISSTAIQWCHQRFPGSSVNYLAQDLFQAPPAWAGQFDFILESYTLQALPDSLRSNAIQKTASFLAPGGLLLVICRARDSSEPPGQLPWPLTREELGLFELLGLTLVNLVDFEDDEDPPVRRFRAEYRRA